MIDRDGAAASAEMISGSREKEADGDRVSDVECVPMRELGLAPGTIVAESYRIVRALGAGGMGVVTLAHDEKLDRDVAIKFVRPELFKSAKLRDALLFEARAMARVTHTNVLTVYSFGDHEGIPYFVMEYVDGPTVEEWLAQRTQSGVMPEVGEAMRIFDQVCLGVDAIHAAATVHRDLKPSNLLIDATMRVAVSDLGVARILEEHARGGAACYIVGSAAYMAPEAALGEEATSALAKQRDVYALGCICYELLTGQPPFDGPTDMSLMAKHLLESPKAPRAVRPDLPAAYDAVLLRALDKDPHRRWQTVEELRGALAEIRAHGEDPSRILIADDDPDWRTLLHDALASRFPQATIETVGDGEEAIAAFEREPYSVVLVDLEMPEVDGMALTKHIRSLAEARSTPILVLTAAGGPGEWKRLSQIGADGFLVKPADPEDVAMMIRRTLKSRRSRLRAA